MLFQLLTHCLSPAWSRENLLQDGPRPRWQGVSHRSPFHNREWGMGGGGNPPSWGNTPQPVNREESVVITLLSQPASLAMLIGMCNGLLIRSNLGSPAQRGLWGGGLARGWGLLRVLPRRAGSVALVPALQNDVLIRHPNPAAQLGILGCCSCVRVYLCVCTCVRVYMCAP